MVFPTLQFILFFTVVLVLNGLTWHRPVWRKAMLIAASYVFYAAWDIRFRALMAAVSTVAWLGGLNRTAAARILSIAALIGALGVFKYFNFFMLSFAKLLTSLGPERDQHWASIILPVGISFYIFQAVSYVMDSHRNHVVPRRDPTDVFLYISFFRHWSPAPSCAPRISCPRLTRLPSPMPTPGHWPSR